MTHPPKTINRNFVSGVDAIRSSNFHNQLRHSSCMGQFHHLSSTHVRQICRNGMATCENIRLSRDGPPQYACGATYTEKAQAWGATDDPASKLHKLSGCTGRYRVRACRFNAPNIDETLTWLQLLLKPSDLAKATMPTCRNVTACTVTPTDGFDISLLHQSPLTLVILNWCDYLLASMNEWRCFEINGLHTRPDDQGVEVDQMEQDTHTQHM